MVAGRSAQEYNQRKKRKGAYREDRYHATAVETGEHLLRCLVYIDLNMVRVGVVRHPSEWVFGGYNEIQSPRRKCVLINYEKLANLAGYDSYDLFRESHKKWVNESLANGSNVRDRQWTRGVAVGEKQFVKKIKTELGSKAFGRQIRETSDGYELRARPKITLHFKRRSILPDGVTKTYKYLDIPTFLRLARQAPQHLKLPSYFWANPNPTFAF